MTMDLTDDAQKVLNASLDGELDEVGSEVPTSQAGITTQESNVVSTPSANMRDTQPATPVYQEPVEAPQLAQKRMEMEKFAQEAREAAEARKAAAVEAGRKDVLDVAAQTGTNPGNPRERHSGGIFSFMTRLGRNSKSPVRIG